ncbi:HNH endonuclease [Candidatus Solirubrobacter pratensis]|uniref:HNH endonuclease n=1 Tax=Candidatus Solirubrobacter pratensis TaxID=1298857 RepID=UPI0003F7D0C9|nr:HNH endonuclease signature motif containing protein [Candidatus Solirubrobacter pratensis]
MLREAKNAGFVTRGVWFWKRYVFHAGKRYASRGMKRAEFADAAAAQERDAVRVLVSDDARQYWWCRGCFYWDDDGLSPQDVYALVYERERRKQRQLERAHAVLATDTLPQQPRREVIPREVRRAVFERDRGRCVECGSNFDIQYDHVIPVALGGANTVANLQLLCAPCNQTKGASL